MGGVCILVTLSTSTTTQLGVLVSGIHVYKRDKNLVGLVGRAPGNGDLVFKS